MEINGLFMFNADGVLPLRSFGVEVSEEMLRDYSGYTVYSAYIDADTVGRVYASNTKYPTRILVPTCEGMFFNGGSSFYSKRLGRIVTNKDNKEFSLASKALIMARETMDKLVYDGCEYIIFAVGNCVYAMTTDTHVLSKISYRNSLLKPRMLSFTQCEGDCVYEKLSLDEINVWTHQLLLALFGDDMFYDYVAHNGLYINHCVYARLSDSELKDRPCAKRTFPHRGYQRNLEYLEYCTSSENVIQGNVVDYYHLHGYPVTAKKEYMDELRERLGRIEDDYLSDAEVFRYRCIKTLMDFNQEYGLFPNFVYDIK